MKWIKENWKEILINFFTMLIVFSMGFSLNYFLDRKKEINKIQKEKLEKIKLENKIIEKRNKISDFKNLDLEGNGILVKELNGEEIYSKNKNKIFPIASIAKIINASVALENFKDEKVYISPRSLKSEGNYGLKSWEVFKQKDAIKYMLIGSINDIASAISFGPKNYSKNWSNFMKKMNYFSKKNKLNNTLFFSENGLNINSHIMGAYSTTNNISKVIEYFYKKYPEISKDTILVETNVCSNEKCHYVKNTNILLEKYPEIIFSKTGYTDLAGGSLAIILKIKNKKYIVVILNSTKKGRFNDLEKIILELKKY